MKNDNNGSDFVIRTESKALEGASIKCLK